MSADDEANQRPSGEILTEETARLWPDSVWTHAYRVDAATGADGLADDGATAVSSRSRFMRV